MSAFKLVSMLNPTVVLTAGPAFSAGTSSQATGTVVFADSNGVTFGLSNGTITASAAGGGGGGGGIAAAAGTQTAATGTIVFANSNGLTFGMSGSSRITGSYTVPTQTQFVLSNSNGISFGTNGSTVTASYTVPTQSVQTQASGNIAGTGYTSTTQAGSTVGATLNTAGLSAAWPPFITTFAGQTTQTQPAGNIAGVGTTFNGANISGSMTLDTVGLALSLSVAPGGGGGADGYNILAAGSQTANTTGTVAFVDSNGITWGMSNSSRITASYSQSTHSHSTAPGALAAGTQTATSGTVVFADSNGLTWGMSGSSQVTASYSQSTHSHSTAPGGLAAGTQTATSGTVVFSNSNGISFGMSNSSVVTASYTVPSTAGLLSAVNVSAGTTSNNLSALTFANANGVTFGLNASTVTASHNGLTTARASNDAVGLNTAFTAGPLAWTVNSSGISLNASNAAGTTSGFAGNLISGSMTHNTAGLNLSLNHPAWLTTAAQSIHGHTITVSAQSNTTQASSGTLDMAGLNVQGAGIVSVGVSNNSLIISAAGGGGGVTPVASASNGSFSFTTLAFSNANNVTFGTSAGSIITASVAAPGAAAEQNAINLLGANTAGNTTATGSTIGWSGVNVTLSGTNASQVVISAPATSSLVGDHGISLSTAGSTISIQAPVLPYFFLPQEDQITNLSGHLNGTMSIQNRLLEVARTATKLVVPMNISSVATAANNSTAGINFSISVAIYSENANTLSSMSSTTFSTVGTWTSNATGSVTGAVFMTTPFNVFMTPGEYYFGMNISTAATGGGITGAATTSLGNSISVMGMATGNLGAFSWHTLGSSTNQSVGWAEQGLYTGTTAFTGGINISALSHAGTAAQRAQFGMQLLG